MDDKRFADLEAKRDAEGLSDEEADELGRLMAERVGKPYANAKDREHPESLPPPEGQEPVADGGADVRQKQQLGATGGGRDWIDGPKQPAGTSGNAAPEDLPDREMKEAVEADVGAPAEGEEG